MPRMPLAVHAAAEPDIVAVSDRHVAEELGTSHRLWSRWLQDGRVRKFAVVAEKVTS